MTQEEAIKIVVDTKVYYLGVSCVVKEIMEFSKDTHPYFKLETQGKCKKSLKKLIEKLPVTYAVIEKAEDEIQV